MSYESKITASPMQLLARTILDGGAYAHSDLYSDVEWNDAAQDVADDGLHAEANLAEMEARDKAFVNYPAGDLWRDGPDVEDWLADNARPAESYVPAGVGA